MCAVGEHNKKKTPVQCYAIQYSLTVHKRGGQNNKHLDLLIQSNTTDSNYGIGMASTYQQDM